MPQPSGRSRHTARRRHLESCIRPRTSFPGGYDDALAGNFDGPAFPPFPEVLPRPREDLLLDRRGFFLLRGGQRGPPPKRLPIVCFVPPHAPKRFSLPPPLPHTPPPPEPH